MVGLDRAAVWVQLEVEADLVILGIKKRFADVKPKKLAGNTQTFKLNENNLNEIRVKEKLGKTLVKIDFSYSKYGKENNLYPLENEISKIIVEEKLIDIIEDISLVKITRSDLNYDFVEVCTQEAVKSFYEYHNIISTFYRSLRRAISHQQGVRFENYDLNLDFFYASGRRHTSFSRDWSSDVCSADLGGYGVIEGRRGELWGVMGSYGRSEERRGGKECRSRWSPYH